MEWPPFPSSDTLQENQINSYHDDEYNNYQGLENVQLENNLNSVQPVETSSLNPPSVLHAHEHEAGVAHANNVLPPQNMSSQLHQYIYIYIYLFFLLKFYVKDTSCIS